MISPFDHGYLYGLGVFETIRVYDRHPFLLSDHIHRLNEGMKELNIEKQLSSNLIDQHIKKLLDLNQIDNAYVRLNISAGVGALGLTTESYSQPTELIFMKELHIPENQTKKGVFLNIRRNSPEGEWRLKSHHYLNNILAKREIGSDPLLEGIFLTKEGYVAEGIVSNIFWVTKGIVYTPSLQTGILNGITRQFVMECCKKAGIPVCEGLFLQEDLLESEEVFITNSLQEIVPITEIGDNRFRGLSGETTQALQGMYKQYRTHLMSRHELEE